MDYTTLSSSLTFEDSASTQQCVTLTSVYNENTLTNTQLTVRLSTADSAVLSPDTTNVTVLEGMLYT